MTEHANASEADASAAAPLIQGTVFSHGTMECRDPIKTQRFLTEFLGLHSVRKSPNTQYVWCGGSWFIVCLNMSDKFKPRQGEDYRFALFVDSERAVQEAHAAAVSQKDKWEMLEVRDVVDSDDKVSFNLRDLNGVWWEIYWGRQLRPARLYDHIFSNAQ
jgi:catechol 2,3-dioxygenase-like lactoylglutathione lyase family enzyme